MNKSESKYFNTAILMQQALLMVLEKKDIEYITIKELCEKAGVNRSTFYLHYDNVGELFAETIEMLNQKFLESFEVKDIRPILKTGTADELVFIKEEFIQPYLEFVKNNKRILKMIHKRPLLFKNENLYGKLCEELFLPILAKFGVAENERVFRLEYFTRGTSGIINKWLELDCEMPISKIMEIIIDCVNFSKK